MSIQHFFFDKTHKCFEDKKVWLNGINNLNIVNVSKFMEKYVNESFLKEANVSYIYNGVDLEKFYPVNQDKITINLEKKFTILMCSSNISRDKGYNELVYIATQLKEDEQMVVIGKNSNNLSLPKNIVYIEYLNKTDLSKYYSLADVCVNVSTFETFGNVTVESMACGTPVIVYDIPVSFEIIDEHCGIIVKRSEGPKAVYNAISKIKLSGKDFYKDNCIRTVKNNFSKEQFLKKYLELFDSINKVNKHEKKI